MIKRLLFTSIPFLSLIVAIFISAKASTAHAAASMYVVAPATVTVGDTVSVQVRSNTNGTAENSVEANFSYTDGPLAGVRGTYSGSVITLPISQPDPSGGSASIGGGNPSGFTGDVLIATIIFTAKSPGTANYGLSGCKILKADGQGTDDTGSCSGGVATTINGSATPTPVPTAAATPPPTQAPVAAAATPTPAPRKATTTPTPHPTQQPAKQEQAATPTPTVAPTPPPVVTLPASTPTPSLQQASSTPSSSSDQKADPSQKRSIATAFRDLLDSVKNFNIKSKDTSGLVAILVSLIPILILLLAIVFFIYRLYIMERRRRRTLDRLFEMELSELAALEGKLDLLAEKGSKGREEYREEFKKSKESILRQLRPDYGMPLDKESPQKA